CGDVREAVAPGNAHGDRAALRTAVAELSGTVAPPAPCPVVGCERARVRPAGGNVDERARERDEHRTLCLHVRAVAELTTRVRAPAVRLSAMLDCARVAETGFQCNEARVRRDAHGLYTDLCV